MADGDDQRDGKAAGDAVPFSPATASAIKPKAFVLPEDWQPPAVTDLPTETRALVERWPAGAYQHFAANFQDHWCFVDRKKRTAAGHAGAFRNWLRRVHPEAMRAAKAGLVYGEAAPPPRSSDTGPMPVLPVAAKAKEDDRSAALHTAIAARIGETAYQHWFGGCALLFSGKGAAVGLTVFAHSETKRGWVEDRFAGALAEMAAQIVPTCNWVRFAVDSISTGPLPSISLPSPQQKGQSQP